MCSLTRMYSLTRICSLARMCSLNVLIPVKACGEGDVREARFVLECDLLLECVLLMSSYQRRRAAREMCMKRAMSASHALAAPRT
jgi:hypothetical protein